MPVTKTKTIYRQYHLISADLQLRTWLEDDPRLMVGTVITLKRGYEPERRWTVNERSDMTLDRPPTRPWKVGGLTETTRSVP